MIAFRFIIEYSDELNSCSHRGIKRAKKHLVEREPKSLTAPSPTPNYFNAHRRSIFQETLADESIRASATDSKWKTQNVLCRRVKYLNDRLNEQFFLSVLHSHADDSRDNLWKLAPKNLNEIYGKA